LRLKRKSIPRGTSSPPRRPLDPNQKIADAQPSIVYEHALIDDGGPGAHGVDGRGCRTIPGPAGAVDRRDVPPFRAKAIEPAAFMLGALRGEQIRMGIAARPRFVGIARAIELHEMLALEEVIEIARREDQPFPYDVH
jgi:hypothetical protein